MGIMSADFGGRRLRRRVVRWILLVAAILVFFWLLPGILNLYTEWLWFKHDVRYPSVFITILGTQIGLGIVAGVIFLVLLLGNVELARRLARRALWYDEETALRMRLAEVMEFFVTRYLYLALVILAIIVAYSVGQSTAQHWNDYLLFKHGLPFGIKDPVFNRDVGFYVFRLPFIQYLWQWLYLTLIAVFILSAATHYFDKAIRVLRGTPAFASHVKVHLSILLGLILVVKAIGYRIEAFYLLYSDRGAAFGAGYTDINAQLLAYNILFVIALACAALLLINIYFRGIWLPLAGIGFLAVSSLLLNVIYPNLVQRFQVQPNEFGREAPYISHTIEFTRRGFDLEKVKDRELLKVDLLNIDAVKQNIATVNNIRLWDYRPLLETYRKQQELQPYYTFNTVGIDRYTINGRYRQVMLSARAEYRWPAGQELAESPRLLHPRLRRGHVARQRRGRVGPAELRDQGHTAEVDVRGAGDESRDLLRRDDQRLYRRRHDYERERLPPAGDEPDGRDEVQRQGRRADRGRAGEDGGGAAVRRHQHSHLEYHHQRQPHSVGPQHHRPREAYRSLPVL